MKREDYISWNEYFMGIAKISAMRSKDPKTQVGACIVNDDNKILSVGYNGLPNKCSDDDFQWDKSDDLYCSKHAYVVHAELNAILNATTDLKGSTLYTTLFPCNECAKAIIQAGIKNVVYDDIDLNKISTQASIRMFKASGIHLYKLLNLSIDIIKKPVTELCRIDRIII